MADDVLAKKFKGKQEQSFSASSACSVQGPKIKNAPNTKEVFDCILKKYNGSVSVDTISKRLDLFPVGCGDVLKWFKEREEHFLLRQENEKVFEVSVFINKVRLCVDPTCSKKDCKCFHVCRDFIAGFCRFEADCKRNHSFQYDKDRNFISKLKLGGLTEEELSKLLQLSMPQVCLKYNNAACISQNCGRVHICKSFVRRACQGGNCDLGLFHEDTFMEANTAATLKRYDLRFTGRNTNSILNSLLICDKNTSEKQGKKRVFASYEPSEMKVFECLCKEFQCSASFSLISKRTDLFPKEFNDVEAWFRRRKGSFFITESDNGTILKVDAYSVKARLCLSYNSSHFGDCQKQHCSYLHVCKGYITDSCSYGATCPKDHHFQNERNKQLLLRVKLEKLTDDELRKLVMSSTPQVCTEYNNSGSCDAGYACNRIHICSNHLRKVCSEGDNCALQHDSALHTPRTEAILQRYKLNELKRDLIKRIVLVKCDKLTKTEETGHIHGDNPDAPICKDFLLGNCKKGSKCHGHHCTLPFQWQYNSYGEWITFNDGDNEKFEKLFCDVNVDETQVSQISVALSNEHSDRLLESCDGTVLLDDKILIMGNSFATVVTLRRLSTVSYVHDPDDTTATLWTWYWVDEHGYWREYDLNHTGTDLQQALEDAFLRKSPGGFHFRIADQDYKMNFSPESDMSQENVRYGTKRKVRRRPSEFVTGNDIKLLKRPEGMLSAQQTKAKDSHLPSKWSSMPSETQYKRVSLSCLSPEFKDVEKLFKESMKRSVKILKIERVQNPFMWEKYQRKKENMLASKKTFINEKRLFHGTSPSAVEAICKQNFDWRLHGKNATKYGEGSYFALNSWYSDAYATQDDNSSKFMFVAKVLVGSYTVGQSSYRRPPQKDPRNPTSDLYDSCVDDTSSPNIFVLFDTDQFYPEYIIEYCALRQATFNSYSGSNQQPARPVAAPSRAASSGVPQYKPAVIPTVASGRKSATPGPASGVGAAARAANYSNASYYVWSNYPASSVPTHYSNAPFPIVSNPSPYSASPSLAPSGTPQLNPTTFTRPSSSALRSDQRSSFSPTPSNSPSTKKGLSKNNKCSVM
ncbi:protein mono-ADP-ribosyltransferase PARP12-like isoform X1 [Acropora palmata]|uniref:protein mono-ADP-ribosyltransferase PARP12-like isoform X1 n=1 Tax=Acropora palmata TaxID=6131 RepID=UPI003DA1A24B